MGETGPRLDRRPLVREYFLALVEELEDYARHLPTAERDGALRHIGEIRAEMGAA